MKWLIQRLAEPSTWAGLAALVPTVLGMFGGHVSPEQIAAVAGGLAAVLMKEKAAQ